MCHPEVSVTPARCLLLALCLGLFGWSGSLSARTLPPSNPFANPSPLPYQAPPFDRIHDLDFRPALEEGMRVQIAEVGRITASPDPPTFENTVVALERSGRLLTRVNNVFQAITQANTNDALQRLQLVIAPKLAAHADAIHLDAGLFARVRSVYDRRMTLGLDSVQRFLVERYYKDFVRAGALLSDRDKARLRALNAEESKLSAQFQIRLLAATKAGALVISDRAGLAGMSDGEIAAAAEAARARKLEGKWVFPLQNTTQQPYQVSLRDRATRDRLFRASSTRTERGDGNDTRAIVLRLAQLPAARAKLLGFPTIAAYVLDDQMAGTPERALKLLTDLVPAITARVAEDSAAMQALVDREGGGFRLEPWDWQYYAEQVRKAQYAFDESQLKPYFELDRVLQDGVFFTAHELYGLTFQERKDLPVYHPDVRVFEVFDADGSAIALWYADYFKRDEKTGGAWSNTFVDGSGLLQTKPVVYNVANFAKPGPGEPTLLSYDDVTTVFHEFGHALHQMLTRVEYPRLAGANVPTDFIELPSQFNEHWALDPAVLAHYARHVQTGAVMPEELADKLRKAGTFNQGFETGETVQAMLLDLAWHTLPAGPGPRDVDAFEAGALGRFHVATRLIPPRYHSSYFEHIWGGGYTATYYAYMWSAVLDNDAFAWFTEHGGLTRANGQRFRDMVLSRGGTEDAATLYRAFRGRDPDVGPLLEARGLRPR
jgi:peptidyl-dipeptidase Dcp